MSSILFDLQVTQMKYRLAEGNGECFYFIGESQLTAHTICTARIQAEPSCTYYFVAFIRHVSSPRVAYIQPLCEVLSSQGNATAVT